MTHQFAVPVLMYHRVAKLTPEERKSRLMRDLTVDPETFREQVRFLKDEGFTFLHVSEVQDALRQGLPLPRKAVAITFDDGYRDNFTEAFPILQEFGAKATVFMVSKNFDRPERIHWTDAFAMKAGEVAFESHSVSHPDLTVIGREALRHELEESKRVIEDGLGSQVTALAYPAGAFNQTVEVALASAGYLSRWKKGGGPVEPRNSQNMYQLPRVRIHGRTHMDKFVARAKSGVYVQEMRLKAEFRRPS